MDSIKALEKIGLREVSRKTYIELSYLKLMADRDFAKLHRIKTLGFVKIIKREYGIDMSDWVAEFEAYLQEQTESSETKKDESLTSKEWYIDGQKRLYAIAAIAVLVVVTTIFYMLLKWRAVYVEDTSPYNNIIITNESLQSDTDDTNVSEATSVANETALVESQEAIEDYPPDTPVAPIEEQPVLIVPNTEIWVGVIDLKTFKRSTYLQGGDIKLDTSKEQIVITGHGDFSLKTTGGEMIKRFNPQYMIYLHVQNGSVKQITEDEFIEFNKGRLW
ncbi:MAG: hypothetical protein LBC08_05265 [Campylobacteraceae bacterium]|jgi:hypothetical protein|nr:hypothetical protein [Campylobacteraceae bacterium]